MDEIG